ncbi:hypothetical protein CW751_02145 [Brumimicrobium salinarum]|uniref:WG repeat-containing protein n=1 Tax=Brumimicrobium salinarum TaxID=2058658 RepID=A0A2I0R6Z9_9FLAO|nr:WG repeat-containing protein [Brumimicrobium salinarum]PKR82160.1 hypothetical protein CW751_02145 [Brumimicrobium salinarum]
MKTHPIVLFLALIILGSCASLKKSSDLDKQNSSSESALDSVFIDYQPKIPETEYRVFRASKEDKSGWMNVEGKWIIAPEYDIDFKREWSEGINVCRKNGKYGAINYSHEIVIPFEYNFPPDDCSDGLILVSDSLRREAYFSKSGVQMTDFKRRQPEFRHGFAVIKSNRERFAYYPRITLKNSKGRTDIYKGDFFVVNNQFDTLLQFQNVPFFLGFGSLNNNRRTFFLYPFISLHADVGISYGQYGYLDKKGEIAIAPKFRALDVFTPVSQGVVRDADCPFNSNLSKVRLNNDYFFIDTIGNKQFELKSSREKLHDVGNFNNYGIAGYRTFGKVSNSSMIHLIDSTGTIVHEAYESDAPLSYGGGLISHQPDNYCIPIFDMKNNLFRIHTPDFVPFTTFPIMDSSKSIYYKYRDLFGKELNDEFVLTQFEIKKDVPGYASSHKCLIDKNGNAKSSRFPFKSLLSSTFGNFTLTDTTTRTSTFYDFNKNALFECDSCFFVYDFRLRHNGIYKVLFPNGSPKYINYKGKVLSDKFDSMNEKIYDISSQVRNYDQNTQQRLNVTEEEIIQLFEESIMNERIMK